MESGNIHHHLQDQIVGSSSSSASTPTCYGVGTINTTHTDWIPYSMNANGLNPYTTSTQIPRPQQQQNITIPLLSNSQYLNFNMAPDFGFINHQSEIKEEFSDNYYLKFTDMLSSSPNSSGTTDDQTTDDFTTKLLLRSLSSGDNHIMNNAPAVRPELLHSNSSRIFPSVKVSSSYDRELGNSGSFDMNLQALDLLPSSGFGGGLINSSSQNQIGVFRDEFPYGFHHMRQTDQFEPLFTTSNKVSAPSSNRDAEAKRPSARIDHTKPLQSTAPKKSRVETRAPCPPFKVSKEKLGDRIAALQQMVAPFGKTDTASVLMEAIGYIKFLQNQVETLSVPYMKTSPNKTSRVMKGVAYENENHEGTRQDLKSRGLCLVPLSCLSYISDGDGAAVWRPPRFGGPN